MNVIQRIGLWFCSLLLGVSIFSVFFGGAALVVFRVAMMFAFPVAVLYLPVVVALRNAEQERIWTILISGLLVGPASLAVWGLILQAKGRDAHMVWIGDGIDWGVVPCMPLAAVVELLTIALYVAGLKIVRCHAKPALK